MTYSPPEKPPDIAFIQSTLKREQRWWRMVDIEKVFWKEISSRLSHNWGRIMGMQRFQAVCHSTKTDSPCSSRKHRCPSTFQSRRSLRSCPHLRGSFVWPHLCGQTSEFGDVPYQRHIEERLRASRLELKWLWRKLIRALKKAWKNSGHICINWIN